MLFGKSVYVFAGIVFLFGIVVYLVDKKKGKQDDKKFSLSDLIDEQLVVTELSGFDVASWFRSKNPNGNYTNLVVLANSVTLKRLKLPTESVNFFNELLRKFDKVIVQAIFDEKNDELISIRVVVFDTLTDSFKNVLNNNNGFMIVD